MHTPLIPPPIKLHTALIPFLHMQQSMSLISEINVQDLISFPKKKEIQQFLHVYLFEKAEIVYKRVAICVESQETIDWLIFLIQYMIKI